MKMSYSAGISTSMVNVIQGLVILFVATPNIIRLINGRKENRNMDSILSMEMLLSTLRMAIPLVLASVGGTLCERSGIINLGIEGMMLSGAFGAVYWNLYQWESMDWGLIC